MSTSPSEQAYEGEKWGDEFPFPIEVAFYCGFETMSRVRVKFPDWQYWYTERNGDGIGIVLPKAAGTEKLPRFAMGCLIFEWIDPDKEFGSGVRVR